MMRPRFAVLCLAVLVLSFSFTTTPAQETTGTIEGRLVDDAGKPVAFANINVTSPSLQGGRGVMSTSDGYFGVFKLPVGVYKVTVSHVSYQEVIYEEIDVRLGRTTTLGKVTLASKTYEAPAVIVSEKKPLIDPTSTTIGANLVSSEFEDLPIDRDYQNMASLLPHANESYGGDGINFAGSPGQENKYFVDGVETTDPFRGVSGTILPYNFVEEVQVKTGGYEAEYRSSLGGIVNVVSRSGGNDFHGQVFGYFVNNQFSGEPRLSFVDPPETDYAFYDFGVSVGGPIKRDRLWFFAAYNPKFVTEDVQNRGIGTLEDKSVRHIFSGKLDWKVADRTRLSVVFTGDPETRDAVGSVGEILDNPDPVLADVKTGGVNMLARGTHMFSDRFFIESSVSGITRREKSVAATARGRDEVYFVDLETGIGSGGGLGPRDAYTVQITADAKATYILGRHMLKAGVAYRDDRLDFSEDFRYLERYSDSSYAEIRDRTAPGTVRNRIPSVFVQDSWRATDRIQVNAGMRWDGQYLVGSDGKVAQKILDQFQPRVGVIYQPGALGSQKIFATAGRYYQELHTTILNKGYNEGWSNTIIAWDHDPRVDPSGGITVWEAVGEIKPVDDLEGQYYDEVTLGYERQVGAGVTVGGRGIYRTLGQGIEDAAIFPPDGSIIFAIGNPGRDPLGDFPDMKREYTALELTAKVSGGARYNARVSYVLSRDYGNYRGLLGDPNYSTEFDAVDLMRNSTGYLNNDRTHVFKLSGSCLVGLGLSAGAAFWYESGTPLSIFEGSPFPGHVYYVQKRGTADPYGSVTRTPAIWDLDLRFVYDLARVMNPAVQPRLILDILNVGSQRTPVDFDQTRNFGENGTVPNTTYGLATRYQPPMSVRVGVEVGF